MLGYIYASKLKSGHDIGRWFSNIVDKILAIFKKPSKAKMKTVHKTRREKKATHNTVNQKKRIKQEQIDAVLDKISKSGYESLSKEEKELLFKAGKE